MVKVSRSREALGLITVWHQHRAIDDAHIYSENDYDFQAEDGPIEEVEVDAMWFATLPEDPGP